MFLSLFFFAYAYCTQPTNKVALQIKLKHALYSFTEQLDFYYDTAHNNVVFRRYSDLRKINRNVLFTDLSLR